MSEVRGAGFEDVARGVPDDFSFACVVLAAGAGTRFGAPKAAAKLRDGTRFVDSVARAAQTGGADPVVVVLPQGVLAPAQTRAVINPAPESEQIASLRLGLARLANTGVDGTLAWPVDCPLVAPETVREIARAAGQRNAPIVVPTFDGRRGHPTYFARGVWPDLMAVEEGGAQAIVRSYGDSVVSVAVDDEAVLADIDTAAELEQTPAQRPGLG